VKTQLAYGAPNKPGKSVAHGSPLGEEEAQGAKAFYQWDYEEAFTVPDGVYEHFQSALTDAKQKEEAWHDLYNRYKAAYPQKANDLERVMRAELPDEWQDHLPVYAAMDQKIATRTASHDVLNAIAGHVPELFGGAADLSSSTKAFIKESADFKEDHYEGRNVRFGVREFAMAAISNGLSLHGGIRPFASTYFVFSDYMKPAMRLSALMGLPVVYIFTHDSLAVGEDGPTHQPVEQLASFRAMPGLTVIRPADAYETISAWKVALNQTNRPTVLVLSRQGLPVLEETAALADSGTAKGAYVLSPAKKETELLLIGTGSEVHLLVEAQSRLFEKNIDAAVVSMPSWELFEKQSQAYKESVIPPHIKKRLAVEMGASYGWYRYVGLEGKVLGVDSFGASGNGNDLVKRHGFTVDRIVAEVEDMISADAIGKVK
jgi:transketolase